MGNINTFSGYFSGYEANRNHEANANFNNTEVKKSVYYRVLHDSIKYSIKIAARDMINHDQLTIDELNEFLVLIDKYMEQFPKNRTRPIIRKMIVDKLNEKKLNENNEPKLREIAPNPAVEH
jgi:hypothetical protein